MKEYAVQIDTNTKSKRGRGNYAQWSATTTLDIKSVGIEGDETVVASEEFAPGETGYMVFIGWGSGDSFGRATNATLEAIHLFKSKTLAEILFWKIHVDAGVEVDYMKESPVHYTLDNGATLELYTSPWKGYFEHIDTLYIVECRLGENYARILQDETPNKYMAESAEDKIKELLIQREKETLDLNILEAGKPIIFKL